MGVPVIDRRQIRSQYAERKGPQSMSCTVPETATQNRVTDREADMPVVPRSAVDAPVVARRHRHTEKWSMDSGITQFTVVLAVAVVRRREERNSCCREFTRQPPDDGQ